jgi:hypothetical protein
LAEISIPFALVLPIDNINTPQLSDRPILVGNPFASSATCQTRTPNCWVNAAAFATPAQYTFGTAGRTEVREPGFDELDFALAKNYIFAEKRTVEFCAEAFSVFKRGTFNNSSVYTVIDIRGDHDGTTIPADSIRSAVCFPKE